MSIIAALEKHIQGVSVAVAHCLAIVRSILIVVIKDCQWSLVDS